MRILQIIGLIFLMNWSYAQIPAPTSAKNRFDGYQKRLELEKNSIVKNVPFTNIGPTIMSGRVVDIAVNPENPSHFYVAYASGSLWETKNNGTSFTPIFDSEIVMTIGDIAVDWKNKILYVGTGENNSSRSSYSGYGIFKSEDNGKNWEHIGLEETQHIGRIVLNPENPNTIYVGAIGHLYSENEERGVYKSQDGGKTWKKTLFISSKTGVIDLVINSKNPNVLLAAAWERDRKAWNFKEAGEESGIYRSEDGGDSWTKIKKSSGFPTTNGVGRIGLDFSASNPNTIYAVLDNQDRRKKTTSKNTDKLTKDQLRNMSKNVFLSTDNNLINKYLDENNFPRKYSAKSIKEQVKADKVTANDLVKFTEDSNSLLFDTPVKGAEMYRSNDMGKTWKKTHEKYIDNVVYSYGYYFGQVRVDPSNPEIVYTMGVPIIRSEDGGKSWKSINENNVHVDHHALWINPKNGNHIILGNDGGVYISYDAGKSWINCNSPAVGQFYAVALDMEKPYNVYGGLQDNGVWKSSSKYKYNRRWLAEGQYQYKRLMGGDGMQIAVDTRDNQTVYTGYQYGNYFRLNTATKQQKYITPKHELGEAPLRWNWEAPILLSPHNQEIVYMGSNKFHRSMNKGDDFQTMSGDLTMGGKKGDVSFGTLTSISESPLRFGLIYVGSDDGLVHISKNSGEEWENISAGLPKNYWISQVWASKFKKERVYVSLNGYRWDNFEPLIYVSEDYGKNWKKIGTSLPNEPVNVIKEDIVNENLLYVGTDHGLYVSFDKGMSFHAFKNGLPNVAVHDLAVHPRDKELVVATHGRSMYKASVMEIQQLNNTVLAKNLHIFPVSNLTKNKNWGKQSFGWFYNTPEPMVSLKFYSNKTGKANIKINTDGTGNSFSFSKTYDIEKGMNYLEIPLFTEKEGEKTYPKAGKYAVRINNSSAEFSIVKPKEKPSRD